MTIHAINSLLLDLDAADAAVNYVRFFCSFSRDDDGPFHVISDIGEIPVDGDPATVLPKHIRTSLFPLRYLGGCLEAEGWQRFEACVLHANTLFTSTLKLFPTGTVEMESHNMIATDLPILQRRYDGAFRTPPM